MDWSDGGLLIQGLLTIYNSFARWSSICHVKRSCNEATHALAKDAIFCDNDVIDLVSVTHCVIVAVHNNVFDQVMKLNVFSQKRK